MNKIPIIFQLEEDIFYFFSFLNLVGYIKEDNRDRIHPLRKIIKQEMRGKLEINRYSSLRKYLSKKHHGQFVQWLLRKKYALKELNKLYSQKDLSFFQRFDKLFREFISKEKRVILWPEAKKFYAIEKKKYYQRIVKELNSLMKTLNVDFVLLDLDRIIVVPNFLDGYNRGYGPKIGKTAFIVYGPLKDEKFRLIKHEFLHSVIHPLVLNNKIFLTKLKKASKGDRLKTQLKKIGYDNWPEIMEEHFVRAINIKTQKSESKRKLLKQEKKKGFKYIEKIYSRLKNKYKKNKILDILEDILNNIDSIVL